MLNEVTIEQRLATLEQTVADLKRRIVDVPTASNWLEKVIGSISDEPAFLEALEYGQLLRHADIDTDEVDEQL
ncbi:transferase hexapeptide repeat containing protein [Nostoc sp. T09]|uniref:transferase hexapeptide repeat containing protein n=1 Tax=Nostoc sp. T09 TaxID=1932621 RepID=UPI000A3CACD3|nr:transferase hexapeptide repeat containing protein [Nostoc sp. T09]OUL36470.1 transferase hexapeptide repeat containing protein [Nostoc sp. T09]